MITTIPNQIPSDEVRLQLNELGDLYGEENFGEVMYYQLEEIRILKDPFPKIIDNLCHLREKSKKLASKGIQLPEAAAFISGFRAQSKKTIEDLLVDQSFHYIEAYFTEKESLQSIRGLAKLWLDAEKLLRDGEIDYFSLPYSNMRLIKSTTDRYKLHFFDKAAETYEWLLAYSEVFIDASLMWLNVSRGGQIETFDPSYFSGWSINFFGFMNEVYDSYKGMYVALHPNHNPDLFPLMIADFENNQTTILANRGCPGEFWTHTSHIRMLESKRKNKMEKLRSYMRDEGVSKIDGKDITINYRN
jgi:hypothetical protein